MPTTGHFLLSRANLIDSIGSAATEAINSYDKHKEASKLTEEVTKREESRGKKGEATKEREEKGKGTKRK